MNRCHCMTTNQTEFQVQVIMGSTKQQNFETDSVMWIRESQMKWNWYEARYANTKWIFTIATKIAVKYDADASNGIQI